MIKNKSLHELIHSLSSSEKRAFKLYASRNTKGSENNYVRLFSLFEKVKPFDDNKIKKLVEKAPFIKYFSAEKNYLYNLLLDCLDIYHRETSIERQISKMINTGRVLMEKKLNAQGAAILQNAKTVSESNERIENIGPINNLLKINDFGREEISFDRINKYHKEEQAILNQLIEKQKYQHAWEKFLLHRRIYGLASDSKAADYLVKEFSHVKEPIPKDFPSFGIEVYYLVSRLEYCRITRNNEEGSIVANKLLATMEKNQKKIAGEFKEL